MSEETKLRVGDVVQLKSGGPDMTVTSNCAEGKVTCHWFGDQNHPNSQTFPEAALEAKGKV